MILKEALNNSLKYSECNKIDLSIDYTEKKIEVKYSDNGCGFDVNKNFSGNGLKNMRFRTKLIGGNIEIVSFPNKGMKIELSVKIN
jgi:NarL family two-component system sensor histidine kinase LiaS